MVFLSLSLSLSLPPPVLEVLCKFHLQHIRLKGTIPDHLYNNDPNMVNQEMWNNEIHLILPVHTTYMHFLFLNYLIRNHLKGSISASIGYIENNKRTLFEQ